MGEALLKLAERCEQATGSDRLLDAEIYVALGAELENLDALAINGEVGTWVPDATASIDAAMTLVPEGWEVALYWGIQGFEPEAQLETEEFRLDHPGEPISGKGKTIALALCAAALRARAKEAA